MSRAFTTLDLARDCASLDCVGVAIQRYSRYIALPRSTNRRERERRVLREQLMKAGVRLAHLINGAAAGTLPVNMLHVTSQ